ncbi:glycoside hydrolase family 32 protein [Aulographum hederae CBS 113979]|uniref:Glycoside hydrolase family 32 protein n=1 Tax=Aulographum hederae CBS 113979 TaxID=1176131 RepID=A0A6G1GU50_9PEZI|nr:glycoside hydrolase family 32 protein [Aulographum hederae CBS 113979]
MLGTFVSLFLAALFTPAIAQNLTTPSPNVPTGRPIVGDYNGNLRPQVHYSPPTGFMNDPNGMFVDDTGLYHLYYQYNPTDTVAGNVHWGHATSRDLYTWENQRIAIFPGAPGEQIFSGSAVVDPNNTSGFFPNQTNGVVAFYTLLNPNGVQTQDVAYSTDGGYAFTKYSGNPVLDANSTQFRDPKVIWHTETGSWIMVTAFAQEYTISIWTSPNLREWTFASNFSHHGLLGLQYECPNLVQIPMNGSDDPMYILYISINPGAPLGGSVGQYFPGHFNGTHFTPVDSAARIADFGKDNYAGQFFYGVPGTQHQISIAWASNWQYTNLVPTASEGWRSAMSAPRRNYLANVTDRIPYQLISEPYEVQSMFSEELAFNDSLANGSVFVDYSVLQSGALYFEANVTGLTETSLTGTLNFTLSSVISGEVLRGGTTIGGDTWLDRGKTSGFDNVYFTDKFSVTGLYDGAGEWRISGIIDRTIIELFVNGGEQSATSIFFPSSPLDTMILRAGGIDGSATVSVGVWGLRSGWLGQEGANGTVEVSSDSSDYSSYYISHNSLNSLNFHPSYNIKKSHNSKDSQDPHDSHTPYEPHESNEICTVSSCPCLAQLSAFIPRLEAFITFAHERSARSADVPSTHAYQAIYILHLVSSSKDVFAFWQCIVAQRDHLAGCHPVEFEPLRARMENDKVDKAMLTFRNAVVKLQAWNNYEFDPGHLKSIARRLAEALEEPVVETSAMDICLDAGEI